MSNRPGQFSFPLPTQLRDALNRIQQLMRGGLTLHDNVSENHIVSYQHTAGANVAQTVNISAMKLSWTPTYWILLDSDLYTRLAVTAANRALWSPTQIVITSEVNLVNLKVMVF